MSGYLLNLVNRLPLFISRCVRYELSCYFETSGLIIFLCVHYEFTMSSVSLYQQSQLSGAGTLGSLLPPAL